jgi:RimJ/RimL family protein N-acetyltransferase
MQPAESLPPLASERLHLRAPREGDEAALVRWLSDIEVARRLAPVPHPYDVAEARGFLTLAIAGARRGDAMTYAVTLRDDPEGMLIGIVGVHGFSATPEIGYWLGKPYWNRGIMTEAAGRVMAEAFARRAPAEVRSGVFEGNDASLAIQYKLGFRRTGMSRRYCAALGAELPHIDTVVTRDAFRLPAGCVVETIPQQARR